MPELGNDEEVERMVAAAWSTVEALGVPDTPMRRIYFDLARLLPTADARELAMGTAAFLALGKEMRDLYARKSPLQQQLEYVRVRRELADLVGEAGPEIPGDAFELDPLPTTPAALGKELGYADGGGAVCRVLRERYPDQERDPKWALITEAQVNNVRAHLPSRAGQ